MVLETVPAPIEDLMAALPQGAVHKQEEFRDQHTLFVSPEKLLEVMQVLRDAFSFKYLIDVTALDHHPQEPRFHIVYHLWSHERGHLLRIKAAVEETPPKIPSVTHLWSSANWCERECFDLFGIVFSDHPDLNRILMPEDWEGHPLRKDYPVEGY
jgi:NADH-quinone oxidoreductase subunit C